MGVTPVKMVIASAMNVCKSGEGADTVRIFTTLIVLVMLVVVLNIEGVIIDESSIPHRLGCGERHSA